MTRKHERSDDCWCKPTIVPKKRFDGGMDWIIVHRKIEESNETDEATG